MISSKWGHFLDRPLGPIAARIKLSPTALTCTGFVISIMAAVVIPIHILAGGILILFGNMFDVLDGLVARTNAKVSEFGAFLDSLLDRFSDAFIFSSIALHLYMAGDTLHAVISIASLFGAFGVSYARARAEGLGYECNTGIMERPERILLLAAGCILNKVLVIVLWMILVGSYVTVIQRITYVRKAMKRKRA